MQAAREVFERDGYHDARLADITTLAGISAGSFYTYFDNKEQVLAAVFEAADEDMLPGTRTPSHERGTDPVARIEQANREYFAAYRRNARLMLLMEQLTALDPEFQERRRQRAHLFTERNAERTAGLQAEGHVDATLDPVLTARALSGMVSRMAYYAFALEADGRDPLGADEEDLTRLATRLWVNALGLTRP